MSMIPSLASLPVSSEAFERSEFLSAPGWDNNACFNCETDCEGNENVVHSSDCTKLCTETQKRVRELITQHGFSVEIEMCGQEGQVCLVRSLTNPLKHLSVKTMVVDNEDAHEYRCRMWNAAAKAGVGPAIHFDACEPYALPTEDGKQFYSFVYMERLFKLPRKMQYHQQLLIGINMLIGQTASSGLLHTDSHWENIMTRKTSGEPGELLFVDWEAGVPFNGNEDERGAAERLMWANLWNSAQSGIGELVKRLAINKGKPWITIDKSEAKLTLEAATNVLKYQKTPFVSSTEWSRETRKALVIMTALEHNITMLEASRKASRRFANTN